MALLLTLLAALLVWQWTLGWLGRGLGVRLGRGERLAACLLAAGVCAPWLVADRLLLPLAGTVARNVPGASAAPMIDRHAAYNDVVLQLLPWESEVRSALRAGRAPWWSDDLDGGSSPWVNPQAAVLAPTAMLARVAPLPDSFLLHFALKMLTGGLGAMVLARRLGIGRACRWVAGVGFGLGGGVVSWGLFALGTVVAWTPWLVAAAVACVRRRGSLLATTLVAAAVLLSGHPESALGAALVSALVALLLLRRRASPGERARRLAGLAAAAALAAMLAAPLLLPQAHAVAGSLRAARAAERAAARHVAARDGEWFPGQQERIALAPLNPQAFGRAFVAPAPPPLPWPVVGSCYSGLLPVLGLLPAVLSRRRRTVTLALLGIAAGLFVLAAAPTPLSRLVARAPAVGAIAFNRWLPAAALLLLMVGCAGLDLVRRRGVGRVPALAALLAGAAGVLSLAHPPRLVAVVALGLAGILALRAGRRSAASLLLLAAAMDLGPWARDYLPEGRRELFFPATPPMRELQRLAAAHPDARVSATGFLAYPSILPMYGMAEIRTNNPVAPAAYVHALEATLGFRPEGARYKGALRHPDSPLLSFLGVRFLLSLDAAPQPRGWPTREGLAGSRWRLHENPRALPRWFLPTRILRVPAGEEHAALAALGDARHVVLAAGEDGAARARAAAAWDPGAVRWSGGRGRVRLALPREGWKLAVGAVPYSPGWRARSGGNALRTVRVDGAFLGVVAGPGTERVDLRYEPPGWRLGAALSAGALLVLAVARGRRRIP